MSSSADVDVLRRIAVGMCRAPKIMYIGQSAMNTLMLLLNINAPSCSDLIVTFSTVSRAILPDSVTHSLRDDRLQSAHYKDLLRYS